MIRQFVVCVMMLAAATTACAQPAAEAEPDDGAVARYGDQVVTQDELANLEQLRLQLVAIKQQEYEITRTHLEQLIFERLVDERAAAEGISRTEYINTHVVEKIPVPTDDEINQIMTQYRSVTYTRVEYTVVDQPPA